jgi:hypothetical protein
VLIVYKQYLTSTKERSMAATEGRHRVVFTISTRLKELLSNYSDLHETTVTEVLKRLIIENCQPPPNKITTQKTKEAPPAKTPAFLKTPTRWEFFQTEAPSAKEFADEAAWRDEGLKKEGFGVFYSNLAKQYAAKYGKREGQ